MAYILNGSNGESLGFEKSIANFALMAVHESTGLVNVTNVVTPTQGNVFEIPRFAPVTWQDYNPAGSGGFTGDAVEQNPALLQSSITATPTVAATAFDIFYGYTTSFQLAATLGQEIGESFNEKVDQRICAAFKSFKLTAGDTMYATSADGFARPSALGMLELLLPAGTADVDSANTVLGLIRMVAGKWKSARLPGRPIVVLDSNGVGSSYTRLLGELTGGAVSQSGGADLSMLGNELLASGSIQNIYGIQVVFTSFLGSVSTNLIGAYFDSASLYTVVKEGMNIKTGEKDGGLQAWLTGTAYMGAGIGDPRRGGAIVIAQA